MSFDNALIHLPAEVQLNDAALISNPTSVSLNDLPPRAFQHPLTLQGIKNSKKIKGFDLLVDNVIEFTSDRILSISPIGRGTCIGPKQMQCLYAAQQGHLQHSLLCAILVVAVILVCTSSKIAFGQVAIPLWQLNSKSLREDDRIDFVKIVFGHLFINTQRGLFILNENGTLTLVKSVGGSFIGYQTVANQLFITTTQGSWFVGVDGNTTQVSGTTGQINVAETAHDEIFAATESGFFIFNRNGIASRVKNIDGNFYGVTVIGDRFWIGTSKGLFVVSGPEKTIRIESVKGIAPACVKFGEKAVVATGEQLLIVDNDGKTVSINGVGPYFHVSVVVGDRLFLGTGNGLFIVDNKGSAVKVHDVKGNSFGIRPLGRKALVGSPDGSWIVTVEGQATVLDGITGYINTTEEVGEHLFVGTDKGLFILDKDGVVVPVKDINCSVSYLQLQGDQVFVGTPCQGIWLLDGQGTPIMKTQANLGNVYEIGSVGEYRYIYSMYGLYRLDPKVRISAKLVPSSWWATALGYLLPAKWLPSEKVQAVASYIDDNRKDPYDEIVPKKFRFAKASTDEVPTYDKFSPQEQFYYETGWGSNEAHYWVKDQWENTFEERQKYYGVPSQYSIVLLPFGFSIVFVLACLGLAPRVTFCHSMVMNPWLRKYLSLGSVPLLLSLSPLLRRYILRRYSSSISRDKEFAEWRSQFVYPDEELRPAYLGKKLASERKLLLTGQSGIGKTSFFKHLTAFYASREKPSFPARVFPVYISLTHYGGNSLEDLVYNQLFSHGKITDKELAPMFLEQGGLLIFLDGVNEVQNVADRQKLSEFVERFWTSNYIFLSSQQGYPEIENILKVELRTFSRGTVCEFIRQRVNEKETAENVIKNLGDEDYQLYCVPLDLEFGVEILNDGGCSLPKSRTELYETTFRAIFARWKGRGNLDAEESLCKYAYMMIAQRDLAFDSVENSQFKEVTTDLFERKFLIRRENSYYFRHELIRSYLASKYFYRRWSNVLAGISTKPVDINWLEMLKFSCEKIKEPDEVKALVYEILKRSVTKDVVKDLFEWLKANQLGKCKAWTKEFYAKYGELDFK